MSRLYIKRGEKHRLGVGRLGMPPYQFGSPTAFWNQRLADDHAIVSDSNNYPAKLAAQMRYTTTSTPRAGYFDAPYNIAIQASSFSVPLWVMPAGYPTRSVYVKRAETRRGFGDFTSGSPTVTNVTDLTLTNGAKVWAPGGWTKDTPSPTQMPCLNHGATIVSGGGTSTLTLSANAIANGTQASIFSTTTPTNSFLNTLQQEYLNVPVPLLADMPGGWAFSRIEAGGTDKALAIWQPSTDTMWEFWLFDGREDYGYFFNYGGVIHNFSQSDGTIPNTWGTRASSLWLVGGVIMIQEYLDGLIPHKLTLALPVTAPTHIPPATRHDSMALIPSGSFADGVAEGAMFRFPANTVINPAWPRMIRMVATAIRDYGLVVTDTGGTAQFWFEDPRSAGTQFSRAAATPDLSAIGPPTVNYNVLPWETLQQIAYP